MLRTEKENIDIQPQGQNNKKTALAAARRKKHRRADTAMQEDMLRELNNDQSLQADRNACAERHKNEQEKLGIRKEEPLESSLRENAKANTHVSQRRLPHANLSFAKEAMLKNLHKKIEKSIDGFGELELASHQDSPEKPAMACKLTCEPGAAVESSIPDRN